MQKSVSYYELDHYDDEVKELTKYEATKIDIVSEIEKIKNKYTRNFLPTYCEYCGRKIELIFLSFHLDLL